MEISGEKATRQDTHFKRERGREGQRVGKGGTEGSQGRQERSRGYGSGRSRVGGPRGLGGRVPLEGSGKGEGSPRTRPTPHISPTPGFPIWAGAACQERPHVCVNGGGEETGAGYRGCKSHKGPKAPPGTAGHLTRGLRGRRPPGPACASAAKQPRPGEVVSGEEGSTRQLGREVLATNSVTSACFRTTLSGLSRFPRSR